MSETKIFAVAGDPVLHSRSPQIFRSLFGDRDPDATYVRLSTESAGQAAAAAESMNLSGFNVTTPFKKSLMPYLDEIDRRALDVGAVNCVVRHNDSWTGYNTDFYGAVSALESRGIGIEKKHIAILGAGGAARAAAYGLIRSGASNVVLMNRTAKKAEEAARSLGCAWAGLDRLPEIVGRSDILISCLTGVQALVGRDLLLRGLVVMDANYRNSRLAGMALEQGCTVISGLDWLFHQALLSFRLFTGREISREIQDSARTVLDQDDFRARPNLALIGFMGSGKSAVGKRLTERMGFEFVDTDTVIENSLGMTVGGIFKKRGEDFFRKNEKSVLAALIPSSRRTIFAIGGGAVLDEKNRAVIGRHCRTVWLWISPSTALKRIKSSPRPLLKGPDDGGKAEEILKSRLLVYAKLSDMVVSNESGSPEDQARRIHHEYEMD